MNKQILALIEPYMDKTLSKGCIIEEKRFSRVKDKIETNLIYHTIERKDYWFDNEYRRETKNTFICLKYIDYPDFETSIYKIKIKNNNDSEFKILGHYDITAVDKYIFLAENYDYGVDHRTYHEFKIYYDKNSKGTDIKIPNKPLLLYTEQEEKDLLELLLKLK